MGLESALWEATRPAFRVRYIHDPTSTPRVPLYASYGFATGPTARAKLARIVRKAPEVVVATHVEPAVEAPAHVEATVEGDATAATAAATEASPADDEATRRAEQLRGLFQTARHDAANAPLAQDEAAGEANRGA